MFVVLGSTGHVGSAVVATLLDAGCPVTAVVRDKAKAEHLRARGAQVEIADVGDVDRLRRVFRKGRRAFLLNPPAPASTDTDVVEHRSMRDILSALDGSGLEKVVLESAYGAQPGERIGDLSVLFDFEQALKAQPTQATILRAAYYMTNWDPLLDAARGGNLPTMFPADLRIPMVAPSDLGRAAVRLLQAPPAQGDIHYVEGPARYSSGEVAHAFSQALGRPVVLSIIPREKWKESYARQGFSAAAADAYARMTAISVDGGFDLPSNPERGSVTLQDYVFKLCRTGAT
ncbi:MAG: NmrA family NAD(P)-binding protein [Hyphomicrobium sp.]